MLRTIALALALAAAACSPPDSEAPKQAAEAISASETTPAPEAAGAIRATGTVTAIDASAGTVTLDHEAIAAIGWPAMAMQFTAEDHAILQGVNVGDRVSFELKSASEPQVVIAVQRQ